MPLNFSVSDSWPGGIDFNSINLIIDSNTQLKPSINSCTSILNGFNCFISLNLEEERFYLIEIQAKSIIGQFNSKKFNVFFDKTMPSIKIISPQNNAIINSSNVVVSYDANDNYLIDHFELMLDNKTWLNNQLNNSFSFNLTNGLHEVKVKAIDLAGNEAIDSVSFTVNLTNDNDSSNNDSDNGSNGGAGGGASSGGISISSNFTSNNLSSDSNFFTTNYIESNVKEQLKECIYDFPFEHSFPLNKEINGSAVFSLDSEKQFNVVFSFVEEKKLKLIEGCNSINHFFIVFDFNSKKFAIEFYNNLIVSFFEFNQKVESTFNLKEEKKELKPLIFLPDSRFLALIPFILALLLIFIVFKRKKNEKN
jgi:hypothetical protein